MASSLTMCTFERQEGPGTVTRKHIKLLTESNLIMPTLSDFHSWLIVLIHSGQSQERPKAVVSIKPDNNVFRAERVTVRCDVQGGGDTEWTFSWYKNNLTVHTSNTSPEYKISYITESDSGEYTCRGERRRDSERSEISDAVTLTVSGEFCGVFEEHQVIPLNRAFIIYNISLYFQSAKIVLSVSPQNCLTEGDSVTLSCEVRNSSTGWNFNWYKYEFYQRYTSEISRGTGGTYSISPAALRQTGLFWCSAERGEPAFHTKSSNIQHLLITDRDVILESPVHPTSTTEEMIIPTVSKSDEGLYHCKIPEKGKCPQSWISIRGLLL
ncbi:high affinity immunoglobulin gamma Fc receptor I-like [Astyanax mexicanus]|uniref:high affinity immunoglobulin gamma Fc receptor I-like n=1 Tax=Astyanax mexicanus TaxID=7994 RepID=UPI0020CB5D87|nr:high affinity immunoglobulin gamma Fc receptor I-like [Astyanax mexicanus]